VRDVAQLEVKQIRIFPPDLLPFRMMFVGPIGERFRQRYAWGDLSLVPTGAIQFVRGTFAPPGSDAPCLVNSCEINDRRIIVQVSADSATATAFYRSVHAFLAECAPGPAWQDAKPVVHTQETVCSVALDIDWNDLLAPGLVTFLGQQVAGVLSRESAPARVLGYKLSFPIDYQTPPAAAERAITYSQKVLTIEPRPGTTPEERRFFTTSPLDSDSHLELLKSLEAHLKPSR
jgi:hypothetical protein